MDEMQQKISACRQIPLFPETTLKLLKKLTSYVLYDLGSTNGTYVNGVKVTRKELVNSDVVQVGSSKFKFEQ